MRWRRTRQPAVDPHTPSQAPRRDEPGVLDVEAPGDPAPEGSLLDGSAAVRAARVAQLTAQVKLLRADVARLSADVALVESAALEIRDEGPRRVERTAAVLTAASLPPAGSAGSMEERAAAWAVWLIEAMDAAGERSLSLAARSGGRFDASQVSRWRRRRGSAPSAESAVVAAVLLGADPVQALRVCGYAVLADLAQGE